MSASTTDLTGRDARLSAAVSWAKQFIAEAERSLKGQAHQTPQAAAQTVAAIEAIDLPTGDGDAVCRCGHTHFWHEGETGGMCLQPGCPCKVFNK